MSVKELIKNNRFPIIIFISSVITGIITGNYVNNINHFTHDIDGFGELASSFANYFDFDQSIRRAPVYPVLLGTVFFLFGDYNEIALIGFHSTILGLTSILIYFISLKIYKSPIIALLTGLAVGLNPLFHWYIPFYYVEVILTLFVVISLWMGYVAYTTRHWKNTILFGVVLGLTTLIKGVTLLFPLALIMALIVLKLFKIEELKFLTYQSILSKSILAGIFMLLTILPWTIRNKIVSGKWVLISSNIGIEFFRGNIAAQKNSYKFENGIGPILTESLQKEDNILDSLNINNPTELQLDSVFNPMMKEYITKTPDKFITKTVKQIPSFWIFTRNKTTSIIKTLISLFFIVIFIAGFIRKPNFLNYLILIMIIYFNLVYASTLAIARYSYPMFALMVIPGIYFAYELIIKQIIERFSKQQKIE